MRRHRHSVVQRVELESRRSGFLVRGGWSKADIWLSSLPGGARVVVKDFAGKTLVGRVWGWIQIRREEKLLRILDDSRDVPSLIARLGSLALVIEYFEGKPLCCCAFGERKPEYLSQLDRILLEMKQRGVIHNDMRGRRNIHLVEGEDRIVVLDWAGGVYLRPGSLLYRWTFDRLRIADRSAIVKWKQMLWPEALTAADQVFLRRFQKLRPLWPFNRKGLGKSRRTLDANHLQRTK